MYWSLIKKFFKEKGRFPIGKELDDIKKLSGDMEFRQKLIRFPEEKITDYTKDRPTEGPKAEVKKFPTKNKPATQTYSLDFLDLLEDFNKIKANNKKTKKSMFELMDDLQALTKEYKKTETKKITTSDFLRDYFDLPNPQQKRNVTELNGIELFGNETFEELDIINKTGKHPRDKKAEGGKIGFAQGANKKMMIVDLLNKGADLDLIKTITEASDEEIMEAVDFFKYGGAGVPLPTFDESGKMIDDGLYKGRETRPEAKAEGGRIGLKFGFFKKKPKKIKGESENLRKPIERLEKSKQLSKKGEFMEDGETPDYEYYAELLNDAEDSRGFNIQGDETIEVLEDRLKQLKDEEAYWYGQYKAGKLDPEPGEINRSRLTFLKNKSKEAEMSGDKRLITQDELEELDSLEKRFEYLDLEEKAQDVNRKLTNSEIERLKEINDSGYVDFQIEMDRINRNKKATGGRIQSKKSAGLDYLMGF
jgi:hypothetical protein